MRIVFLGAGSIGCFVGGCWKAADLDIGFLGRRKLAADILATGLTVSDYSGWKHSFVPPAIDYSDDPAILDGADLVVVTVKSTATDEAADLIDKHLEANTRILSLQNGISNVESLRDRFGEHNVIAGVVGFNVVRLGPGHWHKSTSGGIFSGESEETRTIAPATGNTPAGLTLSADMRAIAWAKLLLNLNNPVNALSGLSLRQELMDRNFRKVLAASIDEALSVLKSAGIKPAKITPLPPGMLPSFIDTPNWFFNTVGLRLQKVDANARSSMADDFIAGRPTEIDHLNGEIVRLARTTGLAAPVNKRISELVGQAQSGGQHVWRGDALVEELGL